MQKVKCWTAGSNSRKLRGLRVKFWTKKEIFLNRLGVRVESERPQGLFSKKARAKGYAPIWIVRSGSEG